MYYTFQNPDTSLVVNSTVINDDGAEIDEDRA